MTDLAEAVDWLGGCVGGGLLVEAVPHWLLAESGGRGAELLCGVFPASELLLVLLFGTPVCIGQKVALMLMFCTHSSNVSLLYQQGAWAGVARI